MSRIGRNLTAATIVLAASCVSEAPDGGASESPSVIESQPERKTATDDAKALAEPRREDNAFQAEPTPADPPAMKGTLDSLKERAEYEKLGKVAVEALAHAAKERWATQFSGFAYQRAERFSAGGKAHWMAIWLHGKTGLEFVLVPGGRFHMGSPASDPDHQENEKQNWVTLDPFLIARTECTQAIWAKLAGKADLNADPSYFEGSSAHPVENVSAEEVDTWCREAGLVLPTEAQWEFACRAGTTLTYTFGSRLSPTQARTGPSDPQLSNIVFEEGPVSVGSFGSNAFGLFDVHGSMLEWCRDFYLGYEVQAEKGSGMRSGLSGKRVIRGGSFYHPAFWARSASRNSYRPGEGSRLMGFRPSRDLPF